MRSIEDGGPQRLRCFPNLSKRLFSYKSHYWAHYQAQLDETCKKGRTNEVYKSHCVR